MQSTRNAARLAAVALALSLPAPAAPKDPRVRVDSISTEEAMKTAVDAYIYGYPLVTMEMTRRVMTNVVAPSGEYAPMGQFANLRAYPPASSHQVTAPNADTLYSLAWIDLGQEPYVLTIPDAYERYYLMPMLSGWTDVFQVPGKRTTGTRAQTYLITGPGWKGRIPVGLSEYKSPTNLVWIIGRTYCTGKPEDYRAVHAFQSGLSLTPLSALGKSYTPPPGKVDPAIDMKTAVRHQVNRMDIESYFNLLAALMKENPPAAADAPMVARMARIGIVPGQSFQMAKLPPPAAAALGQAPRSAFQKILSQGKGSGVEVDGWTYSLKTGAYETDYLQRAFITAVGLGANRPQDAVYPIALVDEDGNRFDGSSKYILHFPKGQEPPVNAFWSLTMYTPELFFYENPLNKHTVSPRDGLEYNADGSLDLYLQHESPGKDKEANWLPAPAGRFALMMRMYWPKESVLNGSWKAPGVKPQRYGYAVRPMAQRRGARR